MDLIKPMKASAIKGDPIDDPTDWFAEEKYDGHRILVQVEDHASSLFSEKTITAYSRDGLSRDLPPHLLASLEQLPAGVYDGELIVPGGQSHSVTRLDKASKLVYVVFDLLYLGDRSIMELAYVERRACLSGISIQFEEKPKHVRMASAWALESYEDIEQLAKAIWEKRGEGLVLKKADSIYEPGVRSKDWIKIKQIKAATLQVTGFTSGRWGTNSIVHLVDDDGNTTKVKAKSLADLAEIQKDPTRFIGRKLVIEYQNRTRDGKYRHPRWDHWEE